MRLDVTPRQHAAASYMFLVAAVTLLGWLALKAPVLERLSFSHELESLRDVHARSSAVLAADAARRAAPDERPQTPARTFLKGETSALAGAELQNLIKRVMEANDGLLVSSEFRQSTEPLPLTPITVVVRARSSIPALQRILLELDSGRPTLFVDRLSIQSRHRPGRVIRELNEELDVDFEVTGYVNRPFDP